MMHNCLGYGEEKVCSVIEETQEWHWPSAEFKKGKKGNAMFIVEV